MNTENDTLLCITRYDYCLQLMKTYQCGEAMKLAAEAHYGQKYGEHPYFVHLMQVVSVAKSFSTMLSPDGEYDQLLENGAWLHDTIEDTFVSYDTIASKFGHITADLIWSVTGEGKNREERIDSIYKKLQNNKLGCVLKLADRVANVTQSKRNNPIMLAKYESENESFAQVVKSQVPSEMWEILEHAFK